MAEPALAGSIAPNYRTPRLIGILNIVFASGILICGLCMGAYMMTLPMLGKALEQAQASVQKQADNQKQAELSALEEDAKKAKTDAEKSEIDARRREIEARPRVAMMGAFDFNKFMNDPMLIGWYWVELLTGLSLNGLMLASGIGLLKYRNWARKLSINTGWMKIVRLALVYGFFSFVIVPPMSQKMGEMVGEMMAQQQKALGRPGGAVPPTDLFVKTYTIMYTVVGIGTIVVGSIYPGVMIWFLTRPASQAACAPRPKPKQELEL